MNTYIVVARNENLLDSATFQHFYWLKNALKSSEIAEILIVTCLEALVEKISEKNSGVWSNISVSQGKGAS